MQLEKDDDDPNTQPRCNQDKIELDERYFIEMQEKGRCRIADCIAARHRRLTSRASHHHNNSAQSALAVRVVNFKKIIVNLHSFSILG